MTMPISMTLFPVARVPSPRRARPLVQLTAACLAVLAASLVLMPVDPRQLHGRVRLAQAGQVRRVDRDHRRNAGAAAAPPPVAGEGRAARGGRIIVFTAVLELVIITLQAARGIPSHFNATSTPEHRAVLDDGRRHHDLHGRGRIPRLVSPSGSASRTARWAGASASASRPMLAGSAIAFLMPRPDPRAGREHPRRQSSRR